jgi:PTS system mannose-specific IIA component
MKGRHLMIGLVIISHGQLAEEFRNAIVHVLGPQENIEVIGIASEEDTDAGRDDLVAAVERADQGAGVIVLSDMFGGTPSNLAISLLNRKNVEVIAGVNLPMLIKLVSIRSNVSVGQAVIEAQDAGKKYINVASKLIAVNE